VLRKIKEIGVVILPNEELTFFFYYYYLIVFTVNKFALFFSLLGR